jgi:hypothetical protein
LLNHARRGTKDGGPILVGPDWASAEAAFELVAREVAAEDKK